MLRTSLAILALTVSLTFPAMAQDKQAECLKIGQIATEIMAERKNGANDRQAERRVLRFVKRSFLGLRDFVLLGGGGGISGGTTAMTEVDR